MLSTKNDDLKPCNKCCCTLTDENWTSYDKNNGRYICRPCRKAVDKKYYKDTPEYAKKQAARYHSRKNVVIHHYGDICTNCGEDEFKKLTIDHVNNNGGKHRRATQGHTYDFLYNNPIMSDGYQVLCYNCNCSKNVQHKDKYHLRDRTKVFEAYGGQCVECNTTEFKHLTIDHSKNDGAEQRRKYKYGTGATFYRWLIKNKYPQHLGLRVLCYSCNCSKVSV